MQSCPVPRWGGAGHFQRGDLGYGLCESHGFGSELLRASYPAAVGSRRAADFLAGLGAALAGFSGAIRQPAMVYWLSVLAGTLWLGVLSLRIIRARRESALGHPSSAALAEGHSCPELEGQPVFRFVAYSSLLLMAASVCWHARLRAALMVSIMFPLSCLGLPRQHFRTGQSRHGHWWWVVIVMLAWVMGALFGEELFFRGVLLPRMTGEPSARSPEKRPPVRGLQPASSLDDPVPFFEGLAIAGRRGVSATTGWRWRCAA